MTWGQTGRPAYQTPGSVYPVIYLMLGICSVFFLSGTFIFFDHFPLVPKVFPFCSVSWLLQKHASWTVRILLIYFLYKVKEASELHSQHSFASLFVERRSDLSQVSQRSYQ